MEWIILDVADEIRSWGHTEGQPLIMKTDGEPAIKSVGEALSRYLGGSVTPEHPPAGQSQSNGAVEEAGKTVREIMRVYKCQLEDKIGKLEDEEIIYQWMARWAAMAYNRFQQGSDGKTAYQRQTGRTCRNE